MAYIKVYSRGKSLTAHQSHHLIMSFTPGDESEQAAYLRAADTMRMFPGARWAVSEPCFHACAALPVVCDRRSLDVISRRERPRKTDRDYLVAIQYGGEVPRDNAVDLAMQGYTVESYPGRFELTDAGRFGIGLKDEPAPTAEAAA